MRVTAAACRAAAGLCTGACLGLVRRRAVLGQIGENDIIWQVVPQQLELFLDRRKADALEYLIIHPGACAPARRQGWVLPLTVRTCFEEGCGADMAGLVSFQLELQICQHAQGILKWGKGEPAGGRLHVLERMLQCSLIEH